LKFSVPRKLSVTSAVSLRRRAATASLRPYGRLFGRIGSTRRLRFSAKEFFDECNDGDDADDEEFFHGQNSNQQALEKPGLGGDAARYQCGQPVGSDFVGARGVVGITAALV